MEFLQYCQQIMPLLLKGLYNTLKLFSLTIVFSLPLGLIVSFGRVSKFKPLKWLTGVYVWIMRGTPLLLQLFFVYFALPMMFPLLELSSFSAGLLALVLNYAAYFAEIFRAGIESIDYGQQEAAKALGFGYFRTMWHIIVPQMIKRTLPPITNETISLVKDTALTAVIALPDLLQNAKTIVSRDVDVTAYFVVAIMYLIITFVLTMIFRKIEQRFSFGNES